MPHIRDERKQGLDFRSHTKPSGSEEEEDEDEDEEASTVDVKEEGPGSDGLAEECDMATGGWKNEDRRGGKEEKRREGARKRLLRNSPSVVNEAATSDRKSQPSGRVAGEAGLWERSGVAVVVISDVSLVLLPATSGPDPSRPYMHH